MSKKCVSEGQSAELVDELDHTDSMQMGPVSKGDGQVTVSVDGTGRDEK